VAHAEGSFIQKEKKIMTDPPGMVVGVFEHFGDVLFSLWNYTDAEIEVNVGAEAVSPTEPLNDFFQGTNIVVPSNATRSFGGHVDLGMPTYYPRWLPVGVYNLKVQPNTDGIWYEVATGIEVSAPPPVVRGGNPVFSRRAPSSAEALNSVSGGVGMLTTPAIVLVSLRVGRLTPDP
jgi:hypothetical protein